MKKLLQGIVRSGILGYALVLGLEPDLSGIHAPGICPAHPAESAARRAANIVPVSFAVTALLLIFIPIVAVLLGITVLRREPGKLFALGYAVEGPLMLLVAIRLFVVREMTTLLAFVFALAALGMLTFVWQLVDKKIDQRGAILSTLRVLGLTLFALVTLMRRCGWRFMPFPWQAH